jgi:hypothetical protein
MKEHGSSGPGILTIAIAVGVTALVAASGFFMISALGGSSGQESGVQTDRTGTSASVMEMPDFVASAAPDVQLAYEFALQRPDVMMWIPCYCGCGGHSGHRNARDCFVKNTSSGSSVIFEEHGSGCDVCVDIALMARTMTLQGRPLREVRDAVDAKYKDVGPATDTPLPPF